MPPSAAPSRTRTTISIVFRPPLACRHYRTRSSRRAFQLLQPDKTAPGSRLE